MSGTNRCPTGSATVRSACSIEQVQPLLLEHVNLNVPDADAARDFYVHGLGGMENPVGTNARQLHVNVGASQFHLPFKASFKQNEPVSVPQVWPGSIVLWTSEELQEVQARLGAAATVKADTDGKIELRCICPWGNVLTLRQAPADFSVVGRHHGGHSRLVAMPSVVVEVRPGAAVGIMRFYTLVLGCPARVHNRVGGTRCCTVAFDDDQMLHFEESETAPALDAYNHEEAFASHVCIYLATDDAFAAAFERCLAAGVIYVNQRFEGGPLEFASATTWEEARACGQFRLKDMVDVTTGEVALVMEHEVRSPRHKSCPRKPENMKCTRE